MGDTRGNLFVYDVLSAITQRAPNLDSKHVYSFGATDMSVNGMVLVVNLETIIPFLSHTWT